MRGRRPLRKDHNLKVEGFLGLLVFRKTFVAGVITLILTSRSGTTQSVSRPSLSGDPLTQDPDGTKDVP